MLGVVNHLPQRMAPGRLYPMYHPYLYMSHVACVIILGQIATSILLFKANKAIDL